MPEGRVGRDLGSGCFDGPTHYFPCRVYYEDTDAGGIVYHANYLRFAERARTEMMRALGVEHTAVAAADGVLFTVRRCAIDYLMPAVLDDALVVASRVTAQRGASLDLEQRVCRGASELASLELKLACIDARPHASRRAVRLPAQVRASIAKISPDTAR